MQTLHLVGTIAPKARPRVTRNGAFMPPEYRDWKRMAADLFRNTLTPISRPVFISVLLTGQHGRRADSDNVMGGLLDALVDSGVLPDDNLVKVPGHIILLRHSKKPPEIHLKFMDLPELPQELQSLLAPPLL